MSGEVYWIYVVSIRDGSFDAFEDLVRELVAAAEGEEGTVAYQFWTGDGGRTVHIFEHYRNSAAIVSHVTKTLKPFASRLGELADIESVTVYGEPDDEARRILDGWGSNYLKPIAGFSHKD